MPQAQGRVCRAAFLWSQGYLGYSFGTTHPMQPRRLDLLYDLLQEAGLLEEGEVREPTPASPQELQLAHSPEYIQAVERLGRGEQDWRAFSSFGFASTDNPPFAGMHEASALIAGGTLAAARLVLAGREGWPPATRARPAGGHARIEKVQHAFNPAGGLHHAMPARASGFCVYNDPAVAIAWLLSQGLRVLYLDFDAHHGDGVQAIFYREPRVLTVSFHESGQYLFPGTGEISERGEGLGQGYAVNVPLAPFTDDESWLSAVEGLVPELARAFRPDIIVSQHGCDGHIWDPLTHLALTTRAFARAAALTHELAHELCGGRWVATGGGGYEIYRVVPRAWALVWMEMTGRKREDLPQAWRERWQPHSPHALPERFLDAAMGPDPLRIASARLENARTVALVRTTLRP